MYDPIEPIERGKPRCRLMFEIGKDIIFDDCQIVLFGKLEQPMGRRRAKALRRSGYARRNW